MTCSPDLIECWLQPVDEVLKNEIVCVTPAGIFTEDLHCWNSNVNGSCISYTYSPFDSCESYESSRRITSNLRICTNTLVDNAKNYLKHYFNNPNVIADLANENAHKQIAYDIKRILAASTFVEFKQGALFRSKPTARLSTVVTCVFADIVNYDTFNSDSKRFIASVTIFNTTLRFTTDKGDCNVSLDKCAVTHIKGLSCVKIIHAVGLTNRKYNQDKLLAVQFENIDVAREFIRHMLSLGTKWSELRVDNVPTEL